DPSVRDRPSGGRSRDARVDLGGSRSVAQEREEAGALALYLAQARGVGEDEVRDAEVLVAPQRLRDVLRGADEPRRARSPAAEPAGRRPQVVVEHLAARREVEQALLPDGGPPPPVAGGPR